MLVNRLSNWSCTRGMIRYKVHLISPGCPWPIISRIVAWNTIEWIIVIRNWCYNVLYLDSMLEDHMHWDTSDLWSLFQSSFPSTPDFLSYCGWFFWRVILAVILFIINSHCREKNNNSSDVYCVHFWVLCLLSAFTFCKPMINLYIEIKLHWFFMTFCDFAPPRLLGYSF